MADSDDEFDRRKGRDKFRRERNDYERRDDRRRNNREWDDYDRSNRSRDTWSSRSRERREDYREYDSRRRDRGYSPGDRRGMSPPHPKRMRGDWEDYHYDMGYRHHPMSGGGFGGGGPDGHRDSHGSHQGYGGYRQSNRQDHNDGDGLTQPAMMTFKSFLSQQDDSIGDEEAIKKYNEYKLDFKKQQISEFFLAHKEEEWFKSKYHPEECEKRNQEIKQALQKRCKVFVELMGLDRFKAVSCDMEKSEALIKLLDAAVIKMEGGTDFDLTVLDQPELEDNIGNRSRNNSECVVNEQSLEDRKRKRNDSEEEKRPDEPLKLPISADQKELMKQAQEFSKQQQAKNGDIHKEETLKKSKKKRNRDKTGYNYESGSESDSGSGSGSDSGSSSSSDSESEPAPPGMEEEGESTEAPKTEVGEESKDAEAVKEEGEDEEKEEEGEKPEEEKMETKEGESSKEKTKIEEEKDEDTKEKEMEEGEVAKKPRPLHKTSSIFLRNLAPSITKQEVEAMCRRYKGFMRVALQDPQADRNFFRRGWVTFCRDVNIKEICWNLNNIRLRDCELGATLNRELKQRIRPVAGITNHKNVMKADLKAAAKIVQSLDHKWQIWEDPEEEKSDSTKEDSYNFISKNPVLKNITDFLVDEGSFEEEELLGEKIEEKEPAMDASMERDEKAVEALDRLILYLRIVHSIDYYSANEYLNEDEMPHRCGIMHARGNIPSTKPSDSDVNDWIKSFSGKVKYISEGQEKLSETEALRMGKKDPDVEVEKFVTKNTQELSKDKWLCPLSGKKFKGPDFVRKHIFNKHGEKVEEVKKEVQFFNNYLYDPKRPSLPEHPGNRQSSGSQSQNQFSGQGNSGQFQSHHQQGMMGYGQHHSPMMYGNQYQGGGGYGRDSYSRGGDNFTRSPFGSRGFRSGQSGRNRSSNAQRRSDPRGIIEYRDLDAPDDADFF